MSRFNDPIGAIRPATLSIAGFAVAAVAVVAFTAGSPRPPAAAPSASPSTPVVGQPSNPAVSPRPSVEAPDPTEVPTVTPKPTAKPEPTPPTDEPTAEPTAEPTDGGTDAMPITVDLETWDESDVSIDVVDRTGSVIEAVSGSPAEGVSVPSYTLEVTNIDARTLRLKWSDYGIDQRLALFIDEADGHVRMALIQPEPRGPVDTIAFDRELVLSFDRAIEAASVEAILQDGLDTPG